MAKKSGSKRARRHRKTQKRETTQPQDAAFKNACDALISIFAECTPRDVALSLCISDLWLPNISSQIKHAFAFAVFASMPPEAFPSTAALNSYSSFRAFIERVHNNLPSFAGLEDYVPEMDWGEIKSPSRGSNFHIFYGGAVERIYDFITAFGLVHGTNPRPILDMHHALLAQDHVIVHVDRDVAGSGDDVQPGHTEVPAENFWTVCGNAIRSLAERVELANVTSGLAIKLGELPVPNNRAAFGNSVLAGSALPAFLIEIDNRRFPLMLRNAPAAVIDHWAKTGKVSPPNAIADFVANRFKRVIKGPFRLVTRNAKYPFVFSAAVLGAAKPLLIILQDRQHLNRLSSVEASIRSAIKSGDWALQLEGEKSAVQIRNDKGSLQSYDQIAVIGVLSDVSTELGFLDIPQTKIRLFALPDFVTIFDAIENIDEFDRYWSFLDGQSQLIGGFSGPVDRFAAFRDSHALLAGGAVVPTMISLDPHWGATWRYRELIKYWQAVPPAFPDRPKSQWSVKCDGDGLHRLVAKAIPALSWCAVVKNCAVHFVLIVGDQEIEEADGRILELLIHCLADAINQRRSFLSSVSLFDRTQIVTICRVRTNALLSHPDADHADEALFSDWRIVGDAGSSTLDVVVDVNLQHVQRHIADATDATFEVEAAISWMEGVLSDLGITTDHTVLAGLRGTSARSPRFTLKLTPREVDVPDYADPLVPGPEHYKLARRDLAVTFKSIGASPGKFDLEAAKPLIDKARDNYRISIHEIIAKYDRPELVKFCVEQLDQLITRFDREQTRIQLSLTHEVNYDRSEKLAEAHEKFVTESRNYRYLLEASLSMASSGSEPIASVAIIELVARIDWLLVLSSASDVLHNGIDVAGLELDDDFIPHVYYSEITDREGAFANEAADMRLGIGLTPTDRVEAIEPGSPEWISLDQAFAKDVGLSLSKYLAALSILFRWPSANNETGLHFSYSAPLSGVRDRLVELVKDLSPAEADKAIDLVTIKPDRIRRLLGKSVDEIDVPLWEHNKRGDRYILKPVIRRDSDVLLWGAAVMERSARVWRQNLSQGYMPADFDWPNVKEISQDIKASLERQLETATCSILERATLYVAEGVDFARRFPSESFADVGDFDALAYWPELNRWVAVECKYNQPAFCLKDARRLRERIFGRPGKDRAQFEKIEHRTAFFHANIEKLRSLLHWPSPTGSSGYTFHELYVSRDIYWWMRNPPYKVSTQFLRVDALESWLRSNGLVT